MADPPPSRGFERKVNLADLIEVAAAYMWASPWGREGNMGRRSLSKLLNRPAFALRANVEGAMQIALEITPLRACRRLAIHSWYSNGSPS